MDNIQSYYQAVESWQENATTKYYKAYLGHDKSEAVRVVNFIRTKGWDVKMDGTWYTGLPFYWMTVTRKVPDLHFES